MSSVGIVCRVQVAIDGARDLLDIAEVLCGPVSIERPVRWAKAISDALALELPQDNVRPMSFVVDTTTDVAIPLLPAPSVPPNDPFDTRRTYPARYRLPQAD